MSKINGLLWSNKYDLHRSPRWISKEVGIEPSDFYFDVLVQYFSISVIVTYLQNITPKGTYLNPGWFGESKRVPSSNFIDDYSGQTFFFSFNVYNMLPVNLKRYWVDGLELSVGYAARNLSDGSNLLNSNSNKQYYPGVWGSPRFIFTLDYNLVKLLPDGPPFWNWLKQTLNRFKLPSPALEVGPDIEPRFKICFIFFKMILKHHIELINIRTNERELMRYEG